MLEIAPMPPTADRRSVSDHRGRQDRRIGAGPALDLFLLGF